MKKKRITYKAVIVFVISFFILSLLALAGLLEYGKQQRIQYQNIASTKASTVSESINTAIEKTYTLNSLLISYKGNTDFFSGVSGIIYDEVRRYTGMSLKNIALAPDGIVTEVYPVTGNERLIGFDFLDAKMPGNLEAIEACKKGDIYISKPFKLIQGGLGMGARLPIFMPNVSGEKQFWGLVTVTIDLNELLSASDIQSLSKLGSNYCLWYEDEGSRKVIITQSEAKMKNPLNYSFKIKNLNWNIQLEPKKGWVSREISITALIVVILVSFMISLLYVSNKNIQDVNLKLKDIADIDFLTKCYSRNYLNTELINLYDGSWKLPDAKYSLCIVDIDDFRTVNRKYGSEVGDLAIRKIADIVVANTKREKNDKVIRFGGDSFMILFNDREKEEVRENMENILSQIRKLKISGYKDLKLTASIGTQLYDSENPLTYYDQVKKAYSKLLESKKIGNDGYSM